MGGISRSRLKIFTIFVGLAGALALLPFRGSNDAFAFLLGAGISLVTLRSWIRVTDGIGTGFKPPLAASVVFLMLRYGIIAAVTYAMISLLGITPLVLIVGLLASFAAVILELLYQLITSGK